MLRDGTRHGTSNPGGQGMGTHIGEAPTAFPWPRLVGHLWLSPSSAFPLLRRRTLILWLSLLVLLPPPLLLLLLLLPMSCPLSPPAPSTVPIPLPRRCLPSSPACRASSAVAESKAPRALLFPGAAVLVAIVVDWTGSHDSGRSGKELLRRGGRGTVDEGADKDLCGGGRFSEAAPTAPGRTDGEQ